MIIEGQFWLVFHKNITKESLQFMFKANLSVKAWSH